MDAKRPKPACEGEVPNTETVMFGLLLDQHTKLLGL